MMNEMKMQDLMTGDIVVTRDGSVGIVIVEKEAIIYQKGGMDCYYDFTEDLLSNDDYRGADIIEVYRGDAVEFAEYKDYDPIFEREDGIVWTSDMYWEQQKKSESSIQVKNKDVYYCVIQALYGNRTVTEFSEDSADALIAGYLNRSLFDKETADRSFINIPGEKGLVLLYNKHQEEDSLKLKEEAFRKDGYVMKPLAEIPELNIKLYSRCLACRVNEDGTLAGLRNEDYDKVMKYLAE